MYIDRYKKDDGYYYDDGCFYETIEDLLSTGIFKFCGCGMPQNAIEYIRSSLQLIDDIQNLVWLNKISWDEFEERKRKVFPDLGSEYFMWYWLDNMELTEHGGSVPGWLTEFGINILSDLNELLSQNEKVTVPK